MIIETLKLKDYRNYKELTLKPHPGVNLLFGQNGMGKTNLLEAIHFCALGRSHRTSLDRETVMKDRPAGAVGVDVLKKEGRHEIAVRLCPGMPQKKQVFIDRKKVSRLSDLMGVMQVVIFSPEDLMLVKEGPAVRRRYMDMLISQMDRLYFVALQRYQKVLEQRNFLLKEGKRTGKPDTAMLEVYETDMGRTSAVIIQRRRELAMLLQETAAASYRDISGREKEQFNVAYACCAGQQEQDLAGYITAQLKKSRDNDLFRGTTGFGVHREDLELSLNGMELKLYASQGQMRTSALALKLSQLDIFGEMTGEKPVLLLDDVMSELDMTRRTRLLEKIEGLQTFVTCTDESDLDGCLDRRSYRVSVDENNLAMLTEKTPGEQVEAGHDAMEEPDFS